MSKFSNRLDHVKVAAPCPANWDAMSGNDRVRFCSQCNLNVYNLSGMSKIEAARLVNRAEDRVCVRYYRRADGTILTDNCPVGLRAVKRRAIRVANAVLSSVICFLAGVGLNSVVPRQGDREDHQVVVMGIMAATETGSTANRGWEMGDIAAKETGPSIKPLAPDLVVMGKMARKKGVAARKPVL